MHFNDLFTQTVLADLEIGAVPALMGEPGIGKSSFVESLAEMTNTRCFTLPCNQLADKADLTGARLVKDETTGEWSQYFFPHFVINEAIAYAKDNPNEFPILFLDEINRSTSDVTSGVLTLVTLRRMGHQDLPENLRIIVAGNDKGNVTTLDEASISRFVIYRVEPDASTLINILGDDINTWVKKVLEEHPELVFAKNSLQPPAHEDSSDTSDDSDTTDTADFDMFDMFDTGDEMHQITTPRTIDSISRYLNQFSIETIQQWLVTSTINDAGQPSNHLKDVLEAHTGNTDFTVHLLAAIAQDIQQGWSSSPSQKVPQPRIYKELKSAATDSVSAIEDVIDTMTPKDIAGSLLYALYETEDNTHLIKALSEELTDFPEERMARKFINLASGDHFYHPNFKVLMNHSCPFTDKYGVFFQSMFG